MLTVTTCIDTARASSRRSNVGAAIATGQVAFCLRRRLVARFYIDARGDQPKTAASERGRFYTSIASGEAVFLNRHHTLTQRKIVAEFQR